MTEVTAEITTLKNRADFVRLNRGRKFMTPYFILRYGSNPLSSTEIRVGYTVTTKCGNAVIRNRIKRRLRALVAEIAPEQGKPGVDYVLIALAGVKPSAGEVEYPLLREAVQRAFQRRMLHEKASAMAAAWRRTLLPARRVALDAPGLPLQPHLLAVCP